MPLIKYLISKGEVFPNKALTGLLNGQWPPLTPAPIPMATDAATN